MQIAEESSIDRLTWMGQRLRFNFWRRRCACRWMWAA